MSAPISNLDDLAARFDLTDQEVARLKTFDALLLETQAHTNLIARPSIPDRWMRHYADSLQLLPLIPASARQWLDFGSGAGFPGLMLAAIAQDRIDGLRFTLCDSVKKKARFLSDAVRVMGLENVTVSDERVEAFHVKHLEFDVISARAVSALDKLLSLSAPLLAEDGLLIFPKGEKADEELTYAQERWTYECESRPSMTHDQAKILILQRPEPRP